MPNRVKLVFEDEERKRQVQERQEKEKRRQVKIAALADRRAKSKLTLEDLDEKLDIILDIISCG